MSPEFVRRRGKISGYQLSEFEGYAVFRGVISAWGSNVSVYLDSLRQWLNEDTVNDTVIGREGKLIHMYDYSYGFQFLVTEGSCGFVITSIDDPYCPANIISVNPTMSTPVTMASDATMASNTTMATNVTEKPSEVDIDDETAAPSPRHVSNDSNTIPIIALTISCIGTAISLLAVVGLALYVIILKRKYEEERERIFKAR